MQQPDLDAPTPTSLTLDRRLVLGSLSSGLIRVADAATTALAMAVSDLGWLVRDVLHVATEAVAQDGLPGASLDVDALAEHLPEALRSRYALAGIEGLKIELGDRGRAVRWRAARVVFGTLSMDGATFTDVVLHDLDLDLRSDARRLPMIEDLFSADTLSQLPLTVDARAGRVTVGRGILASAAGEVTVRSVEFTDVRLQASGLEGALDGVDDPEHPVDIAVSVGSLKGRSWAAGRLTAGAWDISDAVAALGQASASAVVRAGRVTFEGLRHAMGTVERLGMKGPTLELHATDGTLGLGSAWPAADLEVYARVLVARLDGVECPGLTADWMKFDDLGLASDVGAPLSVDVATFALENGTYADAAVGGRAAQFVASEVSVVLEERVEIRATSVQGTGFGATQSLVALDAMPLTWSWTEVSAPLVVDPLAEDWMPESDAESAAAAAGGSPASTVTLQPARLSVAGQVLTLRGPHEFRIAGEAAERTTRRWDGLRLGDGLVRLDVATTRFERATLNSGSLVWGLEREEVALACDRAELSGVVVAMVLPASTNG